MKKVAIITRRAGYNHGSSLQAYAMAYFISHSGYTCEIIDYDEYSGHPLWKIRPFIENIEWRMLKRMSKFNTVVSNKRYKYLQIRNKQYERFKRFEKRFLPLTTNRYSKFKDLRFLCNNYDAIICGSDQIWSPLLFDPVYLFGFLKEKDCIKTIAYAPSIGIDNINLISTQEIKLMRKIQHISCREINGAKIISQITDREIPVVLDPTLMVSSSVWEGLSIRPVELQIEEPYILCYFLGKNVHQDYINQLQKKSNYKIVNIQMFNRLNELKSDYEMTDIGPCEFLHLIRNAKWVCTDSFHATIFSFLFHKQLSVFQRFKNEETSSQNSRISTLLEILKIESALVKDGSMPDMNKTIDFSDKNEILKNWQEKSLFFISNSIQNN